MPPKEREIITVRLKAELTEFQEREKMYRVKRQELQDLENMYRKRQDEIVSRGNSYKDKFETNQLIIDHL